MQLTAFSKGLQIALRSHPPLFVKQKLIKVQLKPPIFHFVAASGLEYPGLQVQLV